MYCCALSVQVLCPLGRGAPPILGASVLRQFAVEVGFSCDLNYKKQQTK